MLFYAFFGLNHATIPLHHLGSLSTIMVTSQIRVQVVILISICIIFLFT